MGLGESMYLRNLKNRVRFVVQKLFDGHSIVAQRPGDFRGSRIAKPKPNYLGWCAVYESQVVEVAVVRDDAIVVLARKSPDFDVRHAKQIELSYVSNSLKNGAQCCDKGWREIFI